MTKKEKLINNIENDIYESDGLFGEALFECEFINGDGNVMLVFEITWSRGDEPYCVQELTLECDKNWNVLDTFYGDDEVI